MTKVINGRNPNLRANIDADLKADGEALLTDSEWNYLETQRELDRCYRGEVSAGFVATRVGQIRRAFCRGNSGVPNLLTDKGQRDRGGKNTITRQLAMATLLAKDAERVHAVAAFRENVLHKKRLKIDSVAAWIDDKSRAEGPHTYYLFVPVSVEAEIKIRRWRPNLEIVPVQPIVIDSRRPAVGTWTDGLAYFKGRKAVEHPVKIGGELDQLRIVSEELAQRYGWRKAEATQFVLTGDMPEWPGISMRLDHREIETLSRLVLTVDPAVSSRELGKFYQNARKRILNRRYRPLSERHMALAAFDVSHPKMTYETKRKLWNKKYPDCRYETDTVFGRDVKAAKDRLTAGRRSQKESD
jgi:hypothetical protein